MFEWSEADQARRGEPVRHHPRQRVLEHERMGDEPLAQRLQPEADNIRGNQSFLSSNQSPLELAITRGRAFIRDWIGCLDTIWRDVQNDLRTVLVCR